MSLLSNNFCYETLVDAIQWLAGGDDTRLLPVIEDTANFAWNWHCGRFADGALENIALRKGQALRENGRRQSEAGSRRRDGESRTLHVVSLVRETGGHSRVLTKWIQRDLSSSPGVVLTRQLGPIPEFLQTIWNQRNADVTVLDPTASIADRAIQLRELSRGFSRVILHHHPDDVIPILAYAEPGGPPVAMFNHAHFGFSLGSTVSDLIVNTLPFFLELTKKWRFPRETARLYGPPGLQPLRWVEVDKPTAKEALGIGRTNPVALSVGVMDYFRPRLNYDFFRTARALLQRQQDLHIIIVGVSKRDAIVPDALRHHPRLHLPGIVADPRPFYRAADVFLESFPVPSLGATLEAVSDGEALPVPAYASREDTLHPTQPDLGAYAGRRRNEDEYIAFVSSLLEEGAETRANAATLRREFIQQDEAFGEQFPALYERIDRLDHAPREIPVVPCDAGEDSRTIAEVGRRDAARELSRLPRARQAAIAHVRAAARGHERVDRAAWRSMSLMAEALKASLSRPS